MKFALRALLFATAAGALFPQLARAQSQPATQQRETVEFGFSREDPEGDQAVVLMAGGVRVTPKPNQMIRAQSGVATLDRDAWESVLQTRESDSGMPRRRATPPDPRRQLSEEVVRSRLEAFLRAASRGRAPQTQSGSDKNPQLLTDRWFALLRTLYLEGDVVVIQDGIETVRCERFWLSVLDDRAVFENVELRVPSPDKKTGEVRMLVLRAKRLVRQGPRTVGRDISISSCTAGLPHIDLQAAEAELLERGDELEVRANGNTLRLSGTRVLPLPSFSFFTNDQNELPIEQVRGGYSDVEGIEAGVRIGGSWNGAGGAFHHAVTGRDASEFRGRWHADLGWVEKRGFPLRGDLEYRAEDHWRGRTQFYWLDDDGKNIRAIGSRFDKTPITDRQRALLQTENRIRFSEATTLDLTLHQGTDPAVWSEFFTREYYEDEVPETSLHLRSASENRLFTATGRFNLDGWSYTDSRALAPSFVREAPLLTYDWFSQPLAETPWHTPILLTSSTSAGFLQHDLDATNPAAISNRTLRVDQDLELAAPVALSELVGVRPFASIRATHFDETAVDGADDRFAYAAGIRLGTRFQRTWSWLGDDGERKAIRHVVSPVVTWSNRWRVDGQPGNFRQFDQVDSLTESNEVRFEVLNRFQKMRAARGAARATDPKAPTVRQPEDFIWLDLAQTLYPDAGRDNSGDTLGLFEYELILRADVPWFPLPNPRFLFEGERDWDTHTWRTANFGVAVGPVLGIDLRGEYRTDSTERGQIGYGGSTSVFQRWILNGGTQYDLDRHRTNNYSTEIVRMDHDWRIHFRLTYDNVSGSTSFTVEFEPTVGGFFRPRRQNFIAGSRLYGERGDFTRY